MTEINIKTWSDRRANRSLEDWERALAGRMELREKLWDLKAKANDGPDIATADVLFDAMYLAESAVEEAQVHVKALGGLVPPFEYAYHWSKS